MPVKIQPHAVVRVIVVVRCGRCGAAEDRIFTGEFLKGPEWRRTFRFECGSCHLQQVVAAGAD